MSCENHKRGTTPQSFVCSALPRHTLFSCGLHYDLQDIPKLLQYRKGSQKDCIFLQL